MKSPRNILKEAGLKVTEARVALLEAFPKDCDPLSADGLYAKVRAKGIDLATVYRNLASLESAGIVRKVDLHKGSAQYELSCGHHHHHIVCTMCGIVERLESCGVGSAIKKALDSSKRFREIRDHSLELFGICKSCDAS